MPPSELSAVCSNEQWGEIYARVSELVLSHRSTLVFGNTRRLAERVALHLGELLGTDAVASHHGSLPRELRLSAEQRLQGHEWQYPPREGEHLGHPRYGRTGHRHGINLSNELHNIGRQQNSLSESKEISLIPCSGCSVAGSGHFASGRPAGTACRAISPHFRDTPT